MFKVNEDGSIYVTRGDSGLIPVTAKNQDGGSYTFAVGDIVRFKVCRKKNCGDVVLYVKVDVQEANKTEVQVYLPSDKTKIGKVISKPTDYWYEVELVSNSSTQTIIGYDEDGAKIFRLFPEAVEKGVSNE